MSYPTVLRSLFSAVLSDGVLHSYDHINVLRYHVFVDILLHTVYL